MKKAQAAMEFLMTYGWAILVVLVAIAALAYFGVLNPGRFLPESCTIGAGVACQDFKVTAAGTATVIVRNGMGSGISAVTLSLGGTACTPAATTIADGSTTEFTCTATAGTAGAKYKGALTFAYIQEGSTLTHSKTGTLTAKYE
ncbi:MAG: hypothetical protein NTV63_04400 [Candidatus Woesearchaeota archaeon]|nr:hypothetical protein [Candidatus Woesearchaeota archaeon]